MRYLIPKTQSNEIHGRQEYLYDVFHLFFHPHELSLDYIQLIPVGCIGPDCLFIIGHNDQVYNYISKNIDEIHEPMIIATTCFAKSLIKFCNIKKIYVPKTRDDICNIRSGEPFGFDFDITDAELLLYNSTGALIDRINKGYRLI